MNSTKKFQFLLAALVILFNIIALHISMAQAATVSQVPAQLPLFLNNAVPPLNMLVVGRDHKLFFPAYNDASDLDGDGSIDIRYKPSITYLGYFDSNKCYTYGSGYFSPTSTTTTKMCTGNWSGDYLNYLTTSRADALRKVLYGGYRYTDTATQTILSRAYISTDAHTWGKEYTSILIDGYDISKYTPYSVPSAGNYTLFANNSQGTVESTSPPLLRVVPDIANARIFGWVSRDGVQGGTTVTGTTFQTITVTPVDYAVRVEVCKAGFLESNCKLYPNGHYKPTGILHDYGEANQMYFGLVTGTYQNNIQGGVVRKAVSSFGSEIDSSTGILNKTGIVGTLNALKLYPTTCVDSAMSNGLCLNWGNPLAEMMFETMRYFSGSTSPTSTYVSGSADTTLGLSSVTPWTNPYSLTPNAAATNPTYPSCTKPFETLFSDVNPNYDSDLPGSSFSTTNPPSATTALQNLNVSSLGSTIWGAEVGAPKKINIGESIGTTNDLAPTAKSASSFGTIRGLPEEPTKQGTYNAAAVAYFGNTNSITSLGSQKVQTFSIALSSTLPRIQMPVGTGTITLLPFGKVTNTGNTEQITGFYIDSLYNMAGQPTSAAINEGRAQAIFRVVFDDCNQGCDYDMDAIALYTVAVTAAGTLSVTVQTVYSVAGNESHMGYTISGTTADGIYLEVTGGGSGNVHYALDTPGTQLPGSCPCTGNATLLPGLKNGNAALSTGGSSHVRTFTASGSSSSITNLQNPLWYAAKWGGFGGSANTTISLPVTGEWDSNSSGTPNNYFLVTNASTLKAQLAKAFNQILQKNSAVAAPAVIQSLGTTNSNSTYSNSLNVAFWSGDLTKTTAISTTTGTTTTTTTTQNWVASQKMPAWGLRKIMMATSGGTGLQSFSYSNLSNLTYAGVALQGTLTSSQVDFIRGDTSNETSTFRKRASLIGDVVGSGPVVVSTALYLPAVADSLNGSAGDYAAFKSTQANRRAQVYLGANDGMLHAFDAATGVETFAFIPTAVISNLNALAARTYNSDSSLHRYFVDGPSVVSDVYFGSAWHTVLIGSLGAGGREVFALDITDPSNIKLLWEFTSQTDADLGSAMSTPVIARLHSGEWGVIFGNGYNGNNGIATLFVLNVETGATVSKLATTTTAGNNGLSSPIVLDADSDGIADFVYAGDLMGNLWRFDLIGTGALNAATASTSYRVAFSKNPLYTANGPASSGSIVQSITAPPTAVGHPSGVGAIVIFGTGRYFASADKSNTDLQTLYGIWDQQITGGNTASTPSFGRLKLQAQTITEQNNSATFGSFTNAIRVVSQNAVDWTNLYGWYLDLSVANTLLGERLTDPMVISGSVLLASTRTPSTDVCTPGITGWTYGLDPTTGGRTTFVVFNFSRTGIINQSDKYGSSYASAFSTAAGGFVVTPPLTGDLATITNPDPTTPPPPIKRGNASSGRQSWRTIVSP
ncbi:MAG: Neisseria PilC protein [Pseudomonas sp.]|uniref:pilus assembly protein n=1 Tax=Pseudomonas sp. TaxID=306 RepID=UPI00262A2FD0|nr:PilC/PilY family type IV pilus protein [Pseudomonas sp.]MDB6050987.1 Neisseria PilC protein [Pseudomonas sp.]